MPGLKQLLARVQATPGVKEAGRLDSTLHLLVADEETLSRVVALVASAGAMVREVTSSGPGLEELYLNIVHEAEGDDEDA